MIMNDATVSKSSINKKRKNIIPKNKDKKMLRKKKNKIAIEIFQKEKEREYGRNRYRKL